MTKLKIDDYEAEAVGPDHLPEAESPETEPVDVRVAQGRRLAEYLRAQANIAEAGGLKAIAGIMITDEGHPLRFHYGPGRAHDAQLGPLVGGDQTPFTRVDCSDCQLTVSIGPATRSVIHSEVQSFLREELWDRSPQRPDEGLIAAAARYTTEQIVASAAEYVAKALADGATRDAAELVAEYAGLALAEAKNDYLEDPDHGLEALIRQAAYWTLRDDPADPRFARSLGPVTAAQQLPEWVMAYPEDDRAFLAAWGTPPDRYPRAHEVNLRFSELGRAFSKASLDHHGRRLSSALLTIAAGRVLVTVGGCPIPSSLDLLELGLVGYGVPASSSSLPPARAPEEVEVREDWLSMYPPENAGLLSRYGVPTVRGTKVDDFNRWITQLLPPDCDDPVLLQRAFNKALIYAFGADWAEVELREDD